MWGAELRETVTVYSADPKIEHIDHLQYMLHGCHCSRNCASTDLVEMEDPSSRLISGNTRNCDGLLALN